MVMALSIALIVSVTIPATAQQALAKAREDSWLEVAGIRGNPYNVRGAGNYTDRVTACVRAKMAAQRKPQR